MDPTEPEKEINRIERELDAINPPAGNRLSDEVVRLAIQNAAKRILGLLTGRKKWAGLQIPGNFST